MLAVVRGQTEVAQALLATSKVDKNFKNSEGEQIDAILNRISIK